MNVAVFLDMHFLSSKGNIYTETAFPYSFWTRYLDIFDNVIVLARVHPINNIKSNYLRSDGPNVLFKPIPDYHGPYQYVVRRHRVIKAIKKIDISKSAVILRMPSQIGTLAESLLGKSKHPFGLEVVGDPTDALGAIESPFRYLFRWYFGRNLRQQCSNAKAIAFTSYYLKERWDFLSKKAYITSYSSIELNDDAFVSIPKVSNYEKGKTYTIINVGSMEQMYKGHDVLLNALRLCMDYGMSLRLVLLGNGKLKKSFEALSNNLGIQNNLTFKGALPSGSPVYRELDKADLFVLPSKAEGLPRAMIEAMARGLPCIGSNVGGIPELLPPEDMVPPGDVNALARKICEVLGDPERMQRMSERNLQKAKEYREEVLRQRRLEFYRYIRQKTEEWLKSRELK